MINKVKKTSIILLLLVMVPVAAAPVFAASELLSADTTDYLRLAERDQAIDAAFKRLNAERHLTGTLNEEESGDRPGINVSGETQLSAGITSSDAVWQSANYDLNERNWRVLSGDALNKHFSTYDPRIFDRLSVDLDTENEEGFNFHSNIVVDPWSFTGKGPKVTVTSDFDDIAEVQLKYWSNTDYTINETYFTKLLGNSFSVPELKVSDGSTKAFRAIGQFDPRDTFDFSAMEIHHEFQPVREVWFEYANDAFNFRFFPMAYQDQALISDDPLGITNHHEWWEESLWLSKYTPGIYNSGVAVPDFTQGRWDDSLAFLTRDSSGVYLTALRGMSFSWQPQEGTSFSTTIASPKDLWQDYEEVDNLSLASRLKHSVGDNLDLGATLTSRFGFDPDGSETDSKNYVAGFDLGYELFDGLKAEAEILTSKSYYDLNNLQYRTKSRGHAFYFSLVSRYPRKSIIDLEFGYNDIKLEKSEDFLVKSRFYGAHMDQGFESALSSFRETRNDEHWSRHIHFRNPGEYYYGGMREPNVNWDDVSSTRIGDGIDTGRDVLGFRLEMEESDKFSNLFDLRNVHDVDGDYIETVARDEITYKVNDKLTIKGLGIYHDLPKTDTGVDPFIFDPDTGEFAEDLSTNPIDGDQDPTLKSGSVGLEYGFFDWIKAYGIYERTNDYTLGYGNFPRSAFNGQQRSRLFYERDNAYRADRFYLYDQQLFPQPPYKFYNIFKLGVTLSPMDNLQIFLDYTRNEYEIAGQNSDNINHIGFELNYIPTERIGFMVKYTYSRWKDITRLEGGVTDPAGYHNFFAEISYFASKDDEFILQYGEGNTSPVGNMTFDPYGGGLLTLDTQHIIRAYYRKKF
ncbi:hypothetical protein ACFLZ3_00320 [Candidatus Omnitrophota bacterium]